MENEILLINNKSSFTSDLILFNTKKRTSARWTLGNGCYPPITRETYSSYDEVNDKINSLLCSGYVVSDSYVGVIA